MQRWTSYSPIFASFIASPNERESRHRIWTCYYKGSSTTAFYDSCPLISSTARSLRGTARSNLQEMLTCKHGPDSNPGSEKKRRDETRCRGSVKPLTIPAKLPLAADVCGGRRTGPVHHGQPVEGASEAAEAGSRPGLEVCCLSPHDSCL